MSGSPTDPDREEPEEIIEDLESIKSLLDQEDLAHQSASREQMPNPADSDNDVPLLDDPLEEAAKEHEGLPEAAFKTLLGDAWQDSVDDLFRDARNDIQSHSDSWLPEHTDELAQALKVRIDASVKAWLAETLEANISMLRERIVTELSDELLEQMREKLDATKESKD